MTNDKTTIIFLCRHGETEYTRDDRYYGSETPSFTDSGLSQTKSLSHYLRKEPITAVFSSALERSIVTAEVVAKEHNLPVDILPKLNEWNPGDWSNLTRTEVCEQFYDEYNNWALNPAVKKPPQGETYFEVASRSTPVIHTLAEEHAGESIVIIGHNTLNRVILAHMLDIPINICRKHITQNPGSLNKIIYEITEGWKINLLNLVPEIESAKNLDSSGKTIAHDLYTTAKDFSKEISLVHNQLQPIWVEGRNPCVANDGHHWVLPPFKRPVSIGRVEAHFLFNLTTLLKPQITVEIGTGFGYSSMWIAAGILAAKVDNPQLFTIDDHSEGELSYDGLRFARNAYAQLGLAHLIKFVHGRSPEIIPEIFGNKFIDLAFIDGNHRGMQPYFDYKGISNFTRDNSVIIWHDVDKRYTVPDAFTQAVNEGWKGIILNTSCRIGVTYRNEDQLPMINLAFKNASELSLLNNP